jgi:conjugative transfer region protein (TIGR03750 family)
MVLNHINHKMPIYKDCTLGEMMVVGIFAFLIMSLVLSFLTFLFFGFAWIGFAISILSLVHVTRFLLGRLQKIKYGKPYGYYKQLILKKQSFIPLPYVQREGKWSVKNNRKF